MADHAVLINQSFDSTYPSFSSVSLEAAMLPLDNPTRSYAWGSRTVIPDLLGYAEADFPQAELWIGAYPESPSRLADETTDLLTRLRSDPADMLGEHVRDAFGARLPYLMKVLAVERPLSLQVHPDQRSARIGYDGDAPDCAYKDPYHKPELLYAIGDFRALIGLRTVEQLIPVIRSVASAERNTAIFAQIAALLEDFAPRPYQRVAEYIAGLSEDAAAGAIADLASVREVPDPVIRVAGTLAATYPADRAVLFTLLMNYVELGPGEFTAVDAGTPHTYLSGSAVELSVCSDNTVRAGLTRKPTDMRRFLALLDPRPRTTIPPIASRGAERVVSTGHREFEFCELSIGPNRTVRWKPKPRTLLVLDGKVTLTDATEQRTFGRGESVFLPASDGPVEVTGDGLAVQATTGI